MPHDSKYDKKRFSVYSSSVSISISNMLWWQNIFCIMCECIMCIKHLLPPQIFKECKRHSKAFCFSSLRVWGTWSEILREWGTHWFECAPNADWPWQGCYNSRRGLYNHLITKAVSQRGSLLAPSMAASGVPLAASLSDWSMLMASQK